MVPLELDCVANQQMACVRIPASHSRKKQTLRSSSSFAPLRTKVGIVVASGEVTIFSRVGRMTSESRTE